MHLPQRALWKGYLLAIATLLMWVSFPLAARLGGKSELNPYDMFALRLMTASLVLLPFARTLPRHCWTDKRLWALCLSCSLIYCPIVYSGFRFTGAGYGGLVLNGPQAFLVSLLAFLFFGERPNRARCIGIALIGAGIGASALPYFAERLNTQTLSGNLLILTAALLWSLYSVLAAHWRYPVWLLMRFIVFSSALLYLPIYFLFLPKQLALAPLPTIAIQCVVQGILVSILAMLSYLKTLSLLGAARASVFLSLVPIVTGLLAIPLLDETLSPHLLVGLILVSCGSYIASRYGIMRSSLPFSNSISKKMKQSP